MSEKFTVRAWAAFLTLCTYLLCLRLRQEGGLFPTNIGPHYALLTRLIAIFGFLTFLALMFCFLEHGSRKDLEAMAAKHAAEKREKTEREARERCARAEADAVRRAEVEAVDRRRQEAESRQTAAEAEYCRRRAAEAEAQQVASALLQAGGDGETTVTVKGVVNGVEYTITKKAGNSANQTPPNPVRTYGDERW